jgi:hypothetical protein
MKAEENKSVEESERCSWYCIQFKLIVPLPSRNFGILLKFMK